MEPFPEIQPEIQPDSGPGDAIQLDPEMGAQAEVQAANEPGPSTSFEIQPATEQKDTSSEIQPAG